MSAMRSMTRMAPLVLALLAGLLGACVFESQTIECAHGVRCPPGLVCVADREICAAAWRVAACSGVVDGQACDYDGLPGICAQGICEPHPCETASDCSDGNPCTDDVCNQGECEHRDNSAPCDDGVFCNGQQDSCVAGVCTSIGMGPCTDTTICDEVARTCIGCEVDSDCQAPTYTAWGDCEPEADVCALSGTQSRIVVGWQCNQDNQVCEEITSTETLSCPLITDGKSCNDSNACTEADRCTGGTCRGLSRTCDDGNPCTRDACDVIGGCTHEPEPFGTLCPAGNCDGQGTCLACPDTGTTCLTEDPCTVGEGVCRTSGNWVCEEVGPAPDGTPCDADDGQCLGGVCVAP